MVNSRVGFQPRTTPAERRADLAARRQALSDIAAVYTDPDTFTGPITVDVDTDLVNYTSNKTAAADFDGAIHMLIESAGTTIGRITRATSTTAGFLTTSDEDLKENLSPIDDELAYLWMRTIQPQFFNYIDVPDVRHVGYSAQQVAAQWPNGIASGVINPGHGNIEDRTWDADGNETTPHNVWQAWMMDHAKITPILHSCLRTLDTTIEYRGGVLTDHETRIAALEATVDEQAALIADLTAALAELRQDVYYTRQTEAFWQYSNTATPPPGNGQMRTNAGLTTMWIHKRDADGYDRTPGFGLIAGHTSPIRLRIRGTSGIVLELRSTGPIVDSGTYYTIPIELVSGTADDKGFRVEITAFSEIWAEDPPT